MLEGGAGDPHRGRGNLPARVQEEVHRDREPLALLTEQPVGRYARVVEQDRAGVGGAEAELRLLAAGRHARIARLEQERADGASTFANTTDSSAMPPFVT